MFTKTHYSFLPRDALFQNIHWYSIPFLQDNLSAFAKLKQMTINFTMPVCISVRLHGTTGLTMEEFSWDLVFHNFLIICKENSFFFKLKSNKTNSTLQEVHYAFLFYFPQFFLEWKLCQTNAVEKIQTHILYSITYLSKFVPCMR